MDIKKQIIALLLFMSIIIILQFHLPLPIITKSNVKSILARYTDEKVDEINYNFKDNIYKFVRKDGSEVYYKLADKTIIDSKIAGDLIETDGFLKDYDLEMPKDIYIFPSIDRDNFEKLYYKAYVSGIKNPNIDSEEESREKAIEIAKAVIEKLSLEYNLTSIQLVYGDLYTLYALVYDSKKPIDTERLDKHLKEIPQNQWTKDYILWKSENVE
ncbi:MAG: hypothetical protein Q4P29_02090 [Tissierellia bacterium]|nr:hypothetical protein [Tissierellia bacterium]